MLNGNRAAPIPLSESEMRQNHELQNLPQNLLLRPCELNDWDWETKSLLPSSDGYRLLELFSYGSRDEWTVWGDGV